ncbi:cell envelope integrity protein TolA [Shewanella algae]|uniref:cell envelope integrity protein TolA n=1 Tax=Shewanella algae TaxID=38313 RepID=UPI001183730A|nr:cell envelope integrity protein TolA [Shewanella algae]MBO2658669.1 cell envelope integrity protein TolA [Shewanella algae]MBO2662809.1 cell envelope integrity protein TolA [Shewanella algae]MCL1053588.1 cell envelope integrity protein TolA [Shewanella algae]TVL43169.1 protein TolA [Shewanella algae]TVO82713.1 protein TolA [Shewanella algae]
MAGKSDFTVPFIISAVLHIGVIAILAMGVDFQEKPKLPTPQAQSAPVQAVVVDQQKVDDYVQKLKQDKAAAERRERERQQELDRKANEAKKAREQEQERIRKLEVERKQKELETQKAADAAKAAKLKEQQEKEKAQKAEAERKAKEQQRKEAEEAALKAEQKRKAEEAAAKKAEEERKAKEEAERKRKAEEEARRRQEQELADALAAEQAALSATRNRQVMSEVDRYRAMITATIQRNLVVDESMRGKVCKVKVRLAKDGFVTNSQIIEGDPVVCRAAKAAINKAGRLPVSQEPDVYQLMKEINLQVRPEFN